MRNSTKIEGEGSPEALDRASKTRISKERTDFILNHQDWTIDRLHLATGGLSRPVIRIILEAEEKGLRKNPRQDYSI